MSGGDTKSGNGQNGLTSEVRVGEESIKDTRERRPIEYVVVGAVIAVVWGLLSLPVIFYFLPQVSPNPLYFWNGLYMRQSS